MIFSPRRRPSWSLALATWASLWVSTPTVTRTAPSRAILIDAIALLPSHRVDGRPTGWADSTARGLEASLLFGHCSLGWSSLRWSQLRSDPIPYGPRALIQICRPGLAATAGTTNRASSDRIGGWLRAPSQYCPPTRSVDHRPCPTEGERWQR